MNIYIDVVFLLNFFFDFIILVSVDYILRRNANYKKMFVASLIGEITLLLLFIDIPGSIVLLIKCLIPMFMLYVVFGYVDARYFVKNLLYFYLVSMLLGGAIEFLNNQFNYTSNHMGIGFVFMIIIGIFIFIKCVKMLVELKNNYSYYHRCKIYFDDDNYIIFNAFLDTGNKLKVPYLNKSIVLIDRDKLDKRNVSNPIYVPFSSLNNHGLLECYKCLKLEINGKYFDKFLLGISNEKIFLDGIDCIINNAVMEGLK